MADSNNPGQFGKRPDTEEAAREGGRKSGGQFGKPGGADPHEAGRKGAQAQPRSAKAEGGRRSGESRSNND